jgi:hypothetical protein
MAEGKVEEALALYRRVISLDKDNARAAAGQQGALANLRGKTQPKMAPQLPPEDPWKGAIDLLPRVDLDKDVISGKWTDKDGVFWNYEGRPSRLMLPFRPSGEYDIRVEFMRRGANFCVDLILTKSGNPFALVLDRNGVSGFEKILGHDFGDNGSSIRSGIPLEDGHTYVALVEVRNSGVAAYLGGEPIARWKSDYSDLTMNPQWELTDPGALGVGAWDGTLILRRVQLREVTGKGEFIRIPPGTLPKKD